MDKFLSFIFYTIITLWLLGLLGRWLMRRWLRKKQREFSEQFGGGAQYQRNRSSRRQNGREGDVRVQQTARIEKKVSGNVGEYVDFEEVKNTEECDKE